MFPHTRTGSSSIFKCEEIEKKQKAEKLTYLAKPDIWQYWLPRVGQMSEGLGFSVETAASSVWSLIFLNKESSHEEVSYYISHLYFISCCYHIGLLIYCQCF